jgi:hypothetical protein
MVVCRCPCHDGHLYARLTGATLLLLQLSIVTIVVVCCDKSLALQQQPLRRKTADVVSILSRRRIFLEQSVRGVVGVVTLPITTTITATATLSTRPEPASAARGAAELDLEFYVRDLIGGNKKEGNILPSVLPNPLPPPRTLGTPLLPLLLNDACSPSCIPTQALLEGRPFITASTVEESVKSYRTKASRSFASRTTWQEDHVSDQYYFDLTAYALWRTAADLIPNYVDRDVFARTLGRKLYRQLKADIRLGGGSTSGGVSNTSSIQKSSDGDNHPLQDSMPEILQILDQFKASGYCTGYRIRTQDSKENMASSSDNKSKSNRKGGGSGIPSPSDTAGAAAAAAQLPQDLVFDDLDEESLAIGLSVDCLVSVYDPASLGASLQITGEQSRFSPDYVGATLAAAWEAVGIQSSWEILFVDPVYRPNPKDYYPNEQLYQFTLSKK